MAGMIEVRELCKRYGSTLAVDHLSFVVRPGVVTGFLGPNGAGKSTTLRMILGLDAPTAGSATVNGRAYRDLAAPMSEVGALLDATAVHGARTAHGHLRWIAKAGNVPRRRVDEVLELVGLAGAAGRRIGGFSLGMQQRLGIAVALLGDPATLVLDEPVNGLDPSGIVWIRRLLRDLASQGRAILLSSHLMSEMQATADQVVVIGSGRLIADTSVRELTAQTRPRARVVAADLDRLSAVLRGAGATVTPALGGVVVDGLDGARISAIAAAHEIALDELTPQRLSLEDAYLTLTRETTQCQQDDRIPVGTTKGHQP
jgi:ABC-2 type transport system ATP-binding protein